MLKSVIKNINSIADLALEMMRTSTATVDDEDDEGDEGDLEKKLGPKEVYERLTDFKYVAALFFLTDLISVVNMVSVSFQYQIMESSVSFVASQISLLKTHVEGYMTRGEFKWHARMHKFLSSIDGLGDDGSDSNWTREFVIGKSKGTVTDENRCEFYDFVEEYSSALHDCLEERFPHDELIAAFTVCEPQNLKPGSDYGVAQIKTLVEHYKFHPLIDESAVYEEWLAVVAIMREWYDRNPTDNMGAFMKYLWGNFRGKFPSVEMLFEFGAILPMSNAVSEGGFSTMNFIKGKRSANMSTGAGVKLDGDGNDGNKKDDGAAAEGKEDDEAAAEGNGDAATDEGNGDAASDEGNGGVAAEGNGDAAVEDNDDAAVEGNDDAAAEGDDDAAVESNDDAAAEGDDDDEEDAANEADANRLLDEGTTESANSLALVAATSTTKPRKRKAESKHNTLETRVFLFLHMPERGAEFETFLDETTDEYWGLRDRMPKRANGAFASHEVRRENGERRRTEKRKAQDGILTGASAKEIADGASACERSSFQPPTGTEIIPVDEVPELDENFVKKVKKMKVAHRGDVGAEWMVGKVNKHKIEKRTTADGKSKKAKIEFRIANATETAWFRLSKKRYGSRGEWALFKTSASAAKKKAKKKGKKKGKK